MLRPSIFSRNNVDNIFDEMFENPFSIMNGFDKMWKSNTQISTDVKELDNEYLLDFELPGFEKKDIKIELSDGYLSVSATHDEEKNEKNSEGKFIRKERYSGQCNRSFYVGNKIKEEDINASFENGILKIHIPKQNLVEENDEKKYIEID